MIHKYTVRSKHGFMYDSRRGALERWGQDDGAKFCKVISMCSGKRTHVTADSQVVAMIQPMGWGDSGGSCSVASWVPDLISRYPSKGILCPTPSAAGLTFGSFA